METKEMKVKQYRERAPIVEAMQMPGPAREGESEQELYERNRQAHALYQWIESSTGGSFDYLDVYERRVPCPPSGVSIDPDTGRLVVAGLGSMVHVEPGYYVVRDAWGKFEVWGQDAFEQTYEEVHGDD